MTKNKANSPLLGYNTNVRHAGKLFHIQTEDSGIDHPHIITHLFAEGTILATKKTSYAEIVDQSDRETKIRAQMKDQHKAMFVELRDGEHDATAARIFGEAFGMAFEGNEAPEADGDDAEVRVIAPASMSEKPRAPQEEDKSNANPARQSIFATPNSDGEFGEDLISDKSLDEVILSYMADELEK